MSVGIDYGLGKANVDRATGIRYGVISQISILQAWCDDAEADYGDPHCPNCGADTVRESTANETRDYHCAACGTDAWSDEVIGDEPLRFSYERDGYRATSCLDSDVMVLESPYYTFAAFCSPCVPGAGNLDSACDDGVKTYCFGHDWFDDGQAPYRVFRVADNSEVQS